MSSIVSFLLNPIKRHPNARFSYRPNWLHKINKPQRDWFAPNLMASMYLLESLSMINREVDKLEDNCIAYIIALTLSWAGMSVSTCFVQANFKFPLYSLATTTIQHEYSPTAALHAVQF